MLDSDENGEMREALRRYGRETCKWILRDYRAAEHRGQPKRGTVAQLGNGKKKEQYYGRNHSSSSEYLNEFLDSFLMAMRVQWSSIT